MGLLGDLFNLADDIVSIPTDILGITNHYDKKEAKEKARELWDDGEITYRQYKEIISAIDNS